MTLVKTVWECQECNKTLPCRKVLIQTREDYHPLTAEEKRHCLLSIDKKYVRASFRLKRQKRKSRKE